MSIRYLLPQTYGAIRWFAANRCFNTEKVRSWNQHKILCDELVSFDCGLFCITEVETPDAPLPAGTEQLLAVVVRPSEAHQASLAWQGYTFCGYDLVEELSGISAITNCGGSFLSVCYDRLTQYGLIATYREAVQTRRDLLQEAPGDPHADCEILEIWRKLI